jgi:hypothetical protein
LLLITDGKIMDMDETIEAIIDASLLPLSIVIAGVGPEFEKGQQAREGGDCDDDCWVMRGGDVVHNNVVVDDDIDYDYGEDDGDDGDAAAAEMMIIVKNEEEDD